MILLQFKISIKIFFSCSQNYEGIHGMVVHGVNCVVKGRKGAHLLQVKLAPWHVPFHLAGGALIPLSLKLSDSGQIPVI